MLSWFFTETLPYWLRRHNRIDWEWHTDLKRSSRQGILSNKQIQIDYFAKLEQTITKYTGVQNEYNFCECWVRLKINKWPFKAIKDRICRHKACKPTLDEIGWQPLLWPHLQIQATRQTKMVWALIIGLSFSDSLDID